MHDIQIYFRVKPWHICVTMLQSILWCFFRYNLYVPHIWGEVSLRGDLGKKGRKWQMVGKLQYTHFVCSCLCITDVKVFMCACRYLCWCILDMCTSMCVLWHMHSCMYTHYIFTCSSFTCPFTSHTITCICKLINTYVCN